jgi:DNA ligase-4
MGHRKGKDYTYLYGKHVGTGSLTPFIGDAFDPRVEK